MKVKIALIQQSASTDIEANISKGLQNAETALRNGANIICFSELAFTPFYPQFRKTKNADYHIESVPGLLTEKFSALAEKYRCIIILNLYEKEGEKSFDSSPVIGEDGRILGKTRMFHITQYEGFYEQDYYSGSSDEIPVYKTKYGNIGIAICYDRHFPEYMRKLALDGAEIVFIPQAGVEDEWPEGLYEAEIQTAAFQNGYFAALCNRVGIEGNLNFSGESFLCDPTGKVIARAGKHSEEILYAEINTDTIKISPARKLFMKDRRDDLYRKWFKGRKD
ncbi:MAG: carbon-nitrogen hydrolase family protein [Ignavibacteriaceae bacterium]